MTTQDRLELTALTIAGLILVSTVSFAIYKMDGRHEAQATRERALHAQFAACPGHDYIAVGRDLCCRLCGKSIFDFDKEAE